MLRRATARLFFIQATNDQTYPQLIYLVIQTDLAASNMLPNQTDCAYPHLAVSTFLK
jgi:hypothetical protein